MHTQVTKCFSLSLLISKAVGWNFSTSFLFLYVLLPSIMIFFSVAKSRYGPEANSHVLFLGEVIYDFYMVLHECIMHVIIRM